MQSLQTFIDILTRGRKFHICIHDISGLLKTDERDLLFESQIHSKRFCSIAKSTEQGLEFCLKAKSKANNKAVNDTTPFCGHCPWGLFEVALPIVHDKTVQGIIYVGNFIIDEEETRNRIVDTSKLLNMSPEPFFKLMSECEKADDATEAFQIAEIVMDYIHLLPEILTWCSNNSCVRRISCFANSKALPKRAFLYIYAKLRL